MNSTSQAGHSSSTLNSNLLKSLTSVHLPPPPSSSSSSSTSGHTRTSSRTSSMELPHFTPDNNNKRIHNMQNQSASFITTPPLNFNPPNSTFKSMNIDYNMNSNHLQKSSNTGHIGLSGQVLTDISNPMLNTPLSQNRTRPSSNSNFVLKAPPTMQRYQIAKTPAISSGSNRASMSNSYSGYNVNKENEIPTIAASHMMSPAASSPIYDRPTNISKNIKTEASSFDTSASGKLGSATRTVSGASHDQEVPSPEEMPKITDNGEKPQYSYATLIGMAIMRSPQRKLTLSQIYQWINDTFEYYRNSKSGWQNSIRHNLSLNKAFCKQERPKSDPGKGNYWLVEPGYEFQFIKGRPAKRPSGSGGSQNNGSIGTNQQSSGTLMAMTSNGMQSVYVDRSAFDFHVLHNFSPSFLPTKVTTPPPVETRRKTKPHEPSSTDDEYDEDEDDAFSHIQASPYELDGTALNTDNIEHKEDLHSGSAKPVFVVKTPLKRSRTAIGLQHFTRPNNTQNESPTLKKRTFNSSNPSTISEAEPCVKRKRLSPSTGDGTLDSEAFPLLIAPQSNWHPYTIGGHESSSLSSLPEGRSFEVIMQSPQRATVGPGLMLAPLKQGTTMLPPPTSLTTGVVASPMRKALTTGSTAMEYISSPGTQNSIAFSHEYEDLYSSPSAQRLQYIIAEEDDLISRACFGSPDKREARRRQYFEHSGVSGFDDSNSYNVFGVDFCQVVRRVVDDGTTDNDETNDEMADEEPGVTVANLDQSSLRNVDGNPPKTNNTSRYGPFNDDELYVGMNSPIKIDNGSSFSPPKVRRDTAFF